MVAERVSSIQPEARLSVVPLVLLFLPPHMIRQDGHGPNPFYQTTSSTEILVAWLLCRAACHMKLLPPTSCYKYLSWYTISVLQLGILFSNRVLHITIQKSALFSNRSFTQKQSKEKASHSTWSSCMTELEKAVMQSLLILHVSTINFATGKHAIYIYRRYTKILAKIHPSLQSKSFIYFENRVV